MNKDIYEQLVIALSEDYSFEELTNMKFMEQELSILLGSTPLEASVLVAGAIEIKKLWIGRVPNWKPLLAVN